MSSLVDLRAQTRSRIYSTNPIFRPFQDTATRTVVDSVEYMGPGRYGSWSVGDIMEVSRTGEQLFVSGKDDTNSRVSIVRGHNSTDKIALDMGAEVVFKNPRFTAQDIDYSLSTVINDMERKGVYVLKTAVMDDTPPMLEGLVEVLAVYYLNSKGEVTSFPYRQMVQVVNSVEAERVPETIGDQTYYVTYKKKITSPGDLLARQEGIVSVGAAAELLASQIVPSLAEPGQRTDRTVPPGQEARDTRELRARYETMVREEAQLVQYEMSKVPGNVRTEYWRRYNP